MSLKRRQSPRATGRAQPPQPDCGQFELMGEETMELIGYMLPTAAALQALACTCRRWARILRDPKIQATLKNRFATKMTNVRLSKDLAKVFWVLTPSLPNGQLHGSAEIEYEPGLVMCRSWDTGLLSGNSIDLKRLAHGGWSIVHCNWVNGKKHGACCEYAYHTRAVMQDGKWTTIQPLRQEGDWKNGRRHGTHREYHHHAGHHEIEEHEYNCGRWLGSKKMFDGVITETRVPRGRFVDVEMFHYLSQKVFASYTDLAKPRRNTEDCGSFFGEYKWFYEDGTPKFHATFSDDAQLLRAEFFSKKQDCRTVFDHSTLTVVKYCEHAIRVENAVVDYDRDDWMLILDVVGGLVNNDPTKNHLLGCLFFDDDIDDDSSDDDDSDDDHSVD